MQGPTSNKTCQVHTTYAVATEIRACVLLLLFLLCTSEEAKRNIKIEIAGYLKNRACS